MVELVAASIMDGTVNNHGMSVQIISIIQMQQAWVPVIMEQITLDTPLMLQDITKVIMDVETSTITIRTTALVTEVEAEVEEATAVEVMGMVHMNLSHNSIRSSTEIKPMEPLVRQDRSRVDPKLMLPLPVTLMSLEERYARHQK
jgi:hypothetical protein